MELPFHVDEAFVKVSRYANAKCYHRHNFLDISDIAFPMTTYEWHTGSNTWASSSKVSLPSKAFSFSLRAINPHTNLVCPRIDFFRVFIFVCCYQVTLLLPSFNHRASASKRFFHCSNSVSETGNLFDSVPHSPFVSLVLNTRRSSGTFKLRLCSR